MRKTIYFMIGPTAAGKSTALRNNPWLVEQSKQAGVIYDAAFISIPSFESRLKMVKDRGLQKEHPDVTLYCLDNSHNKGDVHVSIEEALTWDYTVTPQLEQSLNQIMEQFITSGWLTPAQIKSLKE